ncbi:hypothetical protein M409DRAFT_50904 [Zasmidium cellare ATCC 36951]|uniref:Uncharacterized protein n=1 Tax=Zasmidium cellare ATCC 36951 TaxID=1080233 RepID=A0A6A6CZ79_ZASCE|nr:uncharacterized protein M409DRAFT_50904 [Zasmidium cellare ATCC 36951]KAF2171468.1 hypothetical protein M409DRAFT_50904 [Zasmidium cellare ATCC 36951]
MGLKQAICLAALATSATSRCYAPNPAFPVPSWPNGASTLRTAFQDLEKQYDTAIKAPKFENTSFSVEVTSKTSTLWSYHHTAANLNPARPGDGNVSPDSIYRIASITKTFTTLAILYQQAAGNLSLDDPVTYYIPELNSSDYTLPWKDITLRSLASQLSGIPREFAQSDIWNFFQDPTSIGLPPATGEGLPTCDEYNYYKPCNRSDLLTQLKKSKPVFAPNQKSTYSNLNFELLGLVLENITKLPYAQIIHNLIFTPLNMTSSSLTKPASDVRAVLPLMPAGEPNYWDVNEGVQNPTGGIYTSSRDMGIYLRYILTHYNALATGVNWFHPVSKGTGPHSFYGMPWEIFSTEELLPESRRPVTFVTKSGGLPGYYSHIYLLEEYGLGISLFVGGNGAVFDELHTPVTTDLIRAAEEAVWEDMQSVYTGRFIPTEDYAHLNTTLTLATSPAKGLHLEQFISNSTDVLAALFGGIMSAATSSHPRHHPKPKGQGDPWHAQLTPTLLHANETASSGEIYRVLPVLTQKPANAPVWEDDCVTDVDTMSYAGKAVNEMVFWFGEDEGDDLVVELPAWNVSLRRVGGREGRAMVVQKGDL